MTNLRPVCLSGCSRRLGWVEKWHDLGAHGLRLGGSDLLSLRRIWLQPGKRRAPPARDAGLHLLRHMQMPHSGRGEFIKKKRVQCTLHRLFARSRYMPAVRFLKGEILLCMLSECVLCVRAASLFHSVFVFWPAAVAAPFCAVVVNELANHYYYALIATINYTHTRCAKRRFFAF